MNNLTNNSSDDIKELFKTVVAGGYCVGCGACAAVKDSPIKIQLNKYSMLQATLDDSAGQTASEVKVQQVCPFSNQSINEDKLGADLFGAQATYINKVGYYQSTYAGHVVQDEFREKGSSGGMGSWFAYTLLEEKLVDGVIHIHSRLPTADDKRLFHYQLSTTANEVRQNSKSRYYPIEFSQMAQLMRDRPGKYLVIGVPCFIKAIRLLARHDEVLNQRIAFCLGLICGHLKSTGFAELLGWQVGIKPANLKAINFRAKIAGLGANKYGITATGMAEGEATETTKLSQSVGQLYGTNWGLGFFKYKACDYCDDVMAETADVTIGDAWLPQYLSDSQGTNVLIIRNSVINDLVTRARESGKLKLDNITTADVIKSQSAGLNHRRQGLSYRLFLADQQGTWRPKKRVDAHEIHDVKTQLKHKLRIEMAQKSHEYMYEATAAGNFQLFVDKMTPIVKQYEALYRPPLWRRIASRIKRLVLKRK